jgi:nitrate/nitrite transporter NarK
MLEKAQPRVAGQSRALWMSTIAFTVCFAVGTIFAIIGVQIKQQEEWVSLIGARAGRTIPARCVCSAPLLT